MAPTDNTIEGLLDRLDMPVEDEPREESEETEIEQEDEAPAERTEAEADEGESDELEPDEDDDPDSDDQDPAPQLYTVKVDGEEKQVTLEELQQSFSGQSYVQKGMREAAELRKQVETEKQQTQQLTQALMQMYQQAQTQGFKAPPKPPSPEMAQEDPIGYMQADAQYRAEMQQFQSERQQMMQLYQHHQQQTQAQRDERLRAEAQRLIEQIPEFGDAKKAPEIRSKLMKTGADIYGFSESELGQIEDARALSVLYDAMRYRELQSSGKEKAAEKAKGARPYVKPGAKRTSTTTTREKQLAKAKRSQSLDDFVDLL